LLQNANLETKDNAWLYVAYWMLFLDGRTEPQTWRKFRKSKCIPPIVDIIWHRSRGDYELHIIALELMFEVCRSERLSEEDLGKRAAVCANVGCIGRSFVEYLLLEVEEDFDENNNLCLCRLIVQCQFTTSNVARPE
jgi:hypothetical protein